MAWGNDSEKQISVMIVEDHELIRFGIKTGLQQHPDVLVIGEAEHGEKAVSFVSSQKPDIVLMDMGMPIMDGIAATEHLKEFYSPIHIIILTSRDHPEAVFSALTAGADAYCMKGIDAKSLVSVMRYVLEGTVWLDPEVAKQIIQALPAGILENGSGATSILTEREQQIMKDMMEGQPPDTLADRFSLSLPDLASEIKIMLNKLAANFAVQNPENLFSGRTIGF